MVNRTVKVEIKADISDFNRKMIEAAAGSKILAKSIDDTNNQMGILVGSALSLGPALIPIAASATPAIMGLASQLGFAALGAGAAAAAFSGIGDTLKAVNQNQIDPTTANLAKMERALAELGPAGENFVMFLQDVRPKMKELQELTREGMFPGIEQGMSEMLTMLPQVEQIVFNVASAMGELAAQGGEALAGPEWEAFFNYLQSEAQPTLMAFGQTLGNFTLGLANMFVAFAPASANFSSSFLEMSRSFAAWTANLPDSQGFQNFLDYLTEMGPRVWDMLGSIGNAIVALVEAAAPVGAVVVPVLGALADAFATIMESDAGPILLGVVTAVNALSLAMRVGGLANIGVIGKGLMMLTANMRGQIGGLRGATSAYFDYGRALDATAASSAKTQAAFSGSTRGAVKAAGAIGILGFAMSDLDDKMGLTNTAMGAMIGMMAGPWGAAAGAGIGAIMDFAAANDKAAGAIERIRALQSAASQPDLNAGQRRDISVTAMAFAEQSGGGEEAWAEVDKVNAALDANKRAAEDAAIAEAGLTEAMSGASSSTREQTLAMLDSIAAHKAHAAEIAGSVNAEIDYERAIDAVTESVKENGRTNDIGTEKGRKNVESLYAQATAWAALDPATQIARGGVESARKTFADAARSMGYSKQEAELLADALLSIPPNTDANVELTGERDVFASIKRIKAYLASVQRNITVTVDVVQGKRVNPGTFGGGTTLKESADGGFISGPGGPRDDAIPAMLSNGEFVINAAATKTNRALLEAINNGGRPQPFAMGGYASSSPAATAVMDRSVAALIAREVGRETAKSFYGATFFMAPDGSIRAKQMGA